MPASRLTPDQVALLVVDVQERLCGAMERDPIDRVLARIGSAIEGAKALGLPIVVTEQYPKGLGRTHSAVRLRLGAFTPFEKLQFSAALPEVLAALGGRRHVLLVGLETHVCVFQTARELVENGYTPHVCADAVASRSKVDWRVGLDLCRDAGGRVTTVEAMLLDLLVRAGTPEFKMVSAAVR